MEEQQIVLALANQQKQRALAELMAQQYQAFAAPSFAQAREMMLSEEKILLLVTDCAKAQEHDDERLAMVEAARQADRPMLMVLAEANQAEMAYALGAAEVIGPLDEDVVVYRRIAQLLHQEELKWSGEYDLTSGVYNKPAFYRRAAGLLRQSKETPYAMLCVDIERFKLVNDLYGAAEGDRLLYALGQRLRQTTKDRRELAGHLTSDIFAVCMPMDQHRIAVLAEDLQKYLKAYPINMELSIAMGVYPITDRLMSVSSMCDRAIMALNTVKGNYQLHLAFYQDEMRKTLLMEQRLIDEMEMALHQGEFVVYYQPQCDMRTREVIGAEALVRWQHPVKGLLNPKEFVDFFERNGFILDLDWSVWEQVCQAIGAWRAGGRQAVPISVNVSRMHLYEMDFPARLQALTDKYQIPPELLELEITESICAQNLERLQMAVTALSAAGFPILMDDFGSGYSSLNILQTIHVDMLKMDMQFLASREAADPKSGDIIESVVRMAQWLNLDVLAEGVRTKEQMEFLLHVGCRYAQGFYFYAPMDQNAFEALLLAENDRRREEAAQVERDMVLVRDLFHIDIVSERILNNLLGAVLVYTYSDGDIEIQQATEGYYQLVGARWLQEHRLLREWIVPEDWPRVQQALEAAAVNAGRGAQVTFRQRHFDGRILHLYGRISFWGESGGRQLFCATLNDIAAHDAIRP